MSLLNVGARALLANQVALQTTGHNIANVSTPGYSRQSVQLVTSQGQFTGGGYIGHGVDVQTILRNHNELITRQAAMAASTEAADSTRAVHLERLQNIFTGGSSGLGQSITDMMNSLSDVVSSPTDLTARTVALTRMSETAARMRAASERVDELQYSVSEQARNNITKINSLAKSIAAVNQQIANAKGNGQTPNDLLDQRDQLIRDINQYVQTTQVSADDGSMSLFIAGSQALVLGTNASSLSLGESKEFPGSGQMKLFFSRHDGVSMEVDENMLGGGEVAGLLKFANSDLSEARNLLGRMAVAIGMQMNTQQSLGLTLDGQPGSPLFSVPASARGYAKGAGDGTVTYADPTKFAASDYEVRFTTPPAGQVVRLSDGKATAFSTLTDPALQDIDGLNFNLTSAGLTGESILFKPFSAAASNIQTLVYSPRDLAAANPINAAMAPSNGGTLQLASLKATDDGFLAPGIPNGVQLTFDAGPPSTYTVTGSTTPASGTAGLTYTPGTPITIDGWQITLQGAPNTGDSVTVGNAVDPQFGDTFTRNAGNATAMLDLRDVKMFDDSTMLDGYASLMAQVGTRTQSAQYAADLSSSIAANLESSRTAISGVNLDEEAALLIQYQQAYQASAKMLQIAQSIFDSLLQTVGR